MNLHPGINKENMRLWVAGMRSGRWPQTHGYLKVPAGDGTPGGLCCLGVGCEVAIEAGIMLTFKPYTRHDGSPVPGAGGIYVDPSGGESRFTLPWSVQRWLGLSGLDRGSDPVVSVEKQDGNFHMCICDADGRPHIHATAANDSLHWSLDRIADEVDNYYGLLED